MAAPERGPAGPVTLTRALNCPNCGAALVMRAAGHSLTIICEGCQSVLDAKDESFKVLSSFESKMRFTPIIPLGTRGKLGGILWEVIGVQVRSINVEGVTYSWSEYLLFNPYRGFRYLTHYEGHWNFVKTVRALPVASSDGSKPAVLWQGAKFTHFQTSVARTTFVLGEFPWQVEGGDSAEVRDYIDPPRMLSSEATGEEITWSLGQYTPAAEIVTAFKLPAQPPPSSVFSNQPNPHVDKAKGIWGQFGWFFLGLFLLVVLTLVMTSRAMIFSNDYSFQKGQGEPAFVTEPFDVKGRTSSVEVSLKTDLDNHWAYFNLALINEANGQAYDFGREISFYRDSEGSEGSREDSVVIPSVAPGRYYLRIEPETPDSVYQLNYHLQVRRDVPSFVYFWLALVGLLIPPIVSHWRSMAFEAKRWMESDYASSSSSSGGDDD